MTDSFDLHRWLDPTTAAPPQRDQFLFLLWISIVECFALKHLGEDPNHIHTQGPPTFKEGISTLKIQLSSTGTLSNLDDSQGTLDQTKPTREGAGKVEISISETEQQLEGARFDFRDPITFTVCQGFFLIVMLGLTNLRLVDPQALLTSHWPPRARFCPQHRHARQQTPTHVHRLAHGTRED